MALVERGQLGGVCLNIGCAPTKTMVASACLAHQARRAAEYVVRIGPVSVDLAAVRERKRAVVAGARQNYASRLAQDGLDLIEGEAHFTGPKSVEVASTVLHGNLIRHEKASTRDRIVPYTVFIDPQLGRVGTAMADAIFTHPLLAEASTLSSGCSPEPCRGMRG